jgi:hypothetical protein
MKKLLLIAIVLLVAANVAVAQIGGNLAVYSDVNALSCDLNDIGVTICEYYVIHMLTPGVTASQFKIDTNHQGFFLTEISPFPVVIGDSRNGIIIAYGACLSGQIHLLTMTYLCQGLTPPCGYMSVVGHPTANPPGLLAVDCNHVSVPAQGYTSYINNDGSCSCTSPIPVQETTWGGVKALYQ